MNYTTIGDVDYVNPDTDLQDVLEKLIYNDYSNLTSDEVLAITTTVKNYITLCQISPKERKAVFKELVEWKE